MNVDQAKAIVHTLTGVPESAPEHALLVGWELGLTLVQACQVLDPEALGGSVDEQIRLLDNPEAVAS